MAADANRVYGRQMHHRYITGLKPANIFHLRISLGNIHQSRNAAPGVYAVDLIM
jgi:hypothetical protein